MRRILYLGLLAASVKVAAQGRVITGRTTDRQTGEALPAVSLEWRGGWRGAITDSAGNFRLAFPEGLEAPVIRASLIGYETMLVRIIPYRNHYEVLMKPEADNLGEVVVTGVTRATLARKTPVPVVLVQATSIERSAESNVIDVLVKHAPGMNAVKTGPNISKPFIRGLGYNRVLTLYDGLRQEDQQWGDEHGIEADGYNIEKAEVIKGPASLIYGSDALAGVVSLLPAMPHKQDNHLHGRVISEYQSNNGLSGTGARLLYATDKWSFAIRAAYRMAGNYRNAVDGRVYNSGFRESNASAYTCYTGKNGNTSLNLGWYNNLQGIPDGSRDSVSRKFTHQVKEGADDDLKARPLVAGAVLSSYALSPLHQQIRHYRAYANGSYAIGKGALSCLAAFQQNTRSEFNHPTQPRQAGMFVRLNTFNYSAGFQIPAAANLQLSTGINGMFQHNANKKATDFPLPDYYLLDNGAYLLANWSRDKFAITGGIRYDVRRIWGDDFYTFENPATGFTERTAGDTAGAYLQFPAFAKTFTGPSFSLGATWQVNKKISLKANLSGGYRAPNITEFAANGLDPGAHIIYLGNRDVVPELSLQQDVGLDIRQDDISATLSLFNNQIRFFSYLSQLADPQGSPLVDAQGNKTLRYAQSSAQLFGMEAAVSWQPGSIKGFTANNSLSVVYGYNRDPGYKRKGINGEYLPMIPPLRLVPAVSQEIAVKKGPLASATFKVEGDINTAQGRYLALNGTESFTPACALINAGIFLGLNTAAKTNMLIALQVNNLLNAVYQSHLSRLKYFEHFAQSPNGHLGIYDMGVNWRFSLQWSF